MARATYFATGTAGVTSIVPLSTIPEDILYVLAVLNSKLLQFYAISHSPIFSGSYFKFSAPYLRKLPIRRINFADARDREKHNELVNAARNNLKLHAILKSTRTDQEATVLQRQIDATDRQIDRLVYELCGLTEAEIAIVEGSARMAAGA